MKHLCLILLFLPFIIPAKAQDDKDLIQFSGVVMTSDSLQAVPYAHIIDLNTGRGTISNYKGFFSFVAHKGDTIRFSSVGFKKAIYVIPEDLKDKKYSVIQLLTRDTIYLEETIIYPWPSKEDFKQAFLNLDIPDDNLERARKNLEREKLRAMGQALPMDGNESTDYFFRQEAKKYYYQGQYPPIQIFNAFAWAEFIKAWKNGDFKRKK